MSRGRYIVLDGDECAGKTTQLELLARRLADEGVRVEAVREPGGDPVAEQLRQIVKHTEAPLTAWAELFIFLAARANMLENVVAPLLAHGIWVVSDRSYASTIVYQGLARGLFQDPDLQRKATLDSDKSGHDYLSGVIKLANLRAKPDLYLILDVPLKVSLQRQLQRLAPNDRFETEQAVFRKRVNEGFRSLNTSGFQLINGDRDKQVVNRAIWRVVLPMIDL